MPLDDPHLNEARERLNLLLVSYLSAPHYSALPLQDQECIDRETVNAFLLDERFQRYGRRSSITGTNNDSIAQSTSTSLSRSAVQRGIAKQGEEQQSQPRLVMTRKAQLFFLGLCSLALLTPSLSSSATSTTASTNPSAINEFIASFLPNTLASWPAWTGTLIRTAPGVVALTSLAAIFARVSSTTISPSSSSLSALASGMSANQAERQNERDEVVRELRRLFSTCKRFIDECTRLDITLEKGFTVLAELDRLAALDSESQQDEHEEPHTAEDDEHELPLNTRENRKENDNWQDLTTIEARLSASHPRQYLPSSTAQGIERKTNRNKRMPALDVRRAIFSALYTIQERLERDLDSLSNSLPSSTERHLRQEASEEENLDGLELVRLLDMYNCHPSLSYNSQQTAYQHTSTAQEEEEQAAEQLYRRTMARRSLSPTLYSEQQRQAQPSHAATKLKRRSGMYIPPSSSSMREDPASAMHHPSGLTQEEHLSRRASWAAFQPSQRNQTYQHTQAPSSPSSILGNRSRNPAMATPPRIRPQSIHFGGVIPSSSSANVASSPLANGARESNSTIKRERRRRSEQLFSTTANSIQSDFLQAQLPDEDTVNHLRCSTSSTASTSSSIGSSAAMRLSISSQGTSADPITAASSIPEMYDSPSRPGHTRRTSLGPISGSNATLKQQNRRSRPLSMHELDFGRSLHRASLSQLHVEKTQLDEVPEADSTASHRSAAAAALERRWSSHAQGPMVSSSTISASSSLASLNTRTRGRPGSLLLQSSPILSSSPQIKRSPVELDSPAASFRSRKSQHHHQHQVRASSPPRSKFALSSLRESSQNVSTLERALVCHLLALKYSSTSSQKFQKILKVLVEMVDGINSAINTETTSLSQTMWEEFEDGPQKAASTEPGSTAPPASVLLATPMTSNSPFQSTPRRGSFVACLPGSYPTSPIIEVDPATPPSDVAKSTPGGSFFPQTYNSTEDEQEHQQPDYAPREPFSSAEQDGRKALAETHVQINNALRSIATKLYMERQDMKEYFIDSQGGTGQSSVAQPYTLEQMQYRHESLRSDLQSLLKSWEEGRVSLRQMKEGRQRRVEGPRNARTLGRQSPSTASEYDNAEEEPSLLSTSAELEKYGSISSVLSSGHEDSLSTPALSPVSQASYQPPNITELLLDSNNDRLPRYGMQEQLYESYVDEDDEPNVGGKGKGKLSREERIAIAKAKRIAKEQEEVVTSQPQANAELISELKDMVAILRYVD